MKDKIKVGYIGLGRRGRGVLEYNVADMIDVEIKTICDIYEPSIEKTLEIFRKKGLKLPNTTTDCEDIFNDPEIDAVFIMTYWEGRADLAIRSMKAGKYTAIEVGCAFDLSECYRLVDTYEETGVPLMMLENCCYGRDELMLLNMVKQGLFGEVVHCDGGYFHYLCKQITQGEEKKHYRLNNYLYRNCDNYPTHALGPIAKILNINNGNRFLYLTSVASKSVGINSYIKNKGIKNKNITSKKFNQGDFVNTSIKCANGETISLSLATTTPTFGNIIFNVYGTGAFFNRTTKSIITSDMDIELEGDWRANLENIEEFYEKYDHPIWKEYTNNGISGGHGGMDHLVLRAFFESVKNGTRPPIDVYDAAAWMAVTPLSEMSIANGGNPVAFPDFTYGKWIEPENENRGKYSLNTIENKPEIKIYPEE